MYATAAVMKLADDGKIDLDKAVTAYIPEFKMAASRYRQITVRMLLNHSSGLYGTTSNNSFTFADYGAFSKEAFLSALSEQTLKADPGAYSVYCNDGFTLAEIVVERVSGMSFTEFIHTNITGPMELEHTYTPADSFDSDLLAGIYYGDNALPQETLGIIGAGGVYASAEDLAAFGSLFYSDAVLSEASRLATQNPEYKNGFWHDDEDSSLSYGLGWDIVELFPFTRTGITVLVKGGDTLNYHASLVVLPEYGMSAAVVSSGGASVYNQLFAERLLIDALGEQGVQIDESQPSLTEAAVAQIPQQELEKAGRYVNFAQLLDIAITPEGVMTFAELPGMEFVYHDDGSYRDADGLMMFKLIEQEDGNVYLWQKAYSVIPGLPPYVASDYAAIKAANEAVDQQALDAWMAYNGKLFFMVNEGCTSQLYLAQPMTSVPVSPDGYVVNRRIVDEFTAIPDYQIPGVGGRDWQILRISTENGKTFLNANGYVMLCQDNVADIFIGSNSICTIQSDGYARWYSIGQAAEMSIEVSMPANSNFYVYNEYGVVTASSIFGDSEAALPQDGWICFTGEIGQQFVLSFTQ